MEPTTQTFFTLDQAREHAARMHKRCRQAAKHTKRTLIFSHTTLLELHGLNLRLHTSLSPNVLHTSVQEKPQRHHIADVATHLWRHPMTQTMIDEQIAGVSVEQAVCQIVAFTDMDSLVMVMDRLTCRNEELRQTTHQNLADYLQGLSRFPGSRKCKAALARSVDNTDSPQETLLRLRMVDVGLPCPAVNFEIPDSRGQQIHIVDMAYPSTKIAIEYDGEYHYTMDHWRYDIHKRNRLMDLGWQVFTATKANLASVTAIADFIRMIGNALHHRTSEVSLY